MKKKGSVMEKNKMTVSQVKENYLNKQINVDLKEFAEGLPLIATALRRENCPEGAVQLALLSICGVQVDASDLLTLSLHG